jgi:hypothetical protein
MQNQRLHKDGLEHYTLPASCEAGRFRYLKDITTAAKIQILVTYQKEEFHIILMLG